MADARFFDSCRSNQYRGLPEACRHERRRGVPPTVAAAAARPRRDVPFPSVGLCPHPGPHQRQGPATPSWWAACPSTHSGGLRGSATTRAAISGSATWPSIAYSSGSPLACTPAYPPGSSYRPLADNPGSGGRAAAQRPTADPGTNPAASPTRRACLCPASKEPTGGRPWLSTAPTPSRWPACAPTCGTRPKLSSCKDGPPGQPQPVVAEKQDLQFRAAVSWHG